MPLLCTFGACSIFGYRKKSNPVKTGSLTSLGTYAASSGAAYATVSPDGRFVYVDSQPGALAGSIVTVMSRNTSSGVLSSVSSASSGKIDPSKVVMSPDGKHAYVPDGRAADGSVGLTVRAYNVNASTGELTGFDTYTTGGSNPGVACISPDGLHLYVPNQSSNDVSIFSRDASTGLLTKVGSNISAGTLPTYSLVSPDGAHVYVSNYTSGNISVYSRNASTGALTSIGNYAPGSSIYSIFFSPDGLSLYAPRYAADVTTIHSRNSSTGVLTAVGSIGITAPTNGVVSFDGKTAYIASYSTNTLGIFSRDLASGGLTSMGSIATGSGPNGVAVTSDNNNVYVANYTSGNVTGYTRN